MKILFIGYGRMGSALGNAWLSMGVAQTVIAVDPATSISPGVECYRSISEVPAHAYDVIVAAVKPGLVAASLGQLTAEMTANATLISIAAGVSCASLYQALDAKCPVIRAMPNTAVILNAGCTALYSQSSLSTEQHRQVGLLFAAVGKLFWVTAEDALNAVTAVSGSGPAYYHLFSEALTNAGISLGLEAELASALAAQTAYGAALMQTAAGADFVELREAVTSPQGTTAAAVAVFEADAGLRSLVARAANARRQRSRQLSWSTPQPLT